MVRLQRHWSFGLLACLTVLLCLIITPGRAIPSPPPPSTPHSLTQTPLDRGKTLYDAGRYTEAIAVLQQALQQYEAQGDTLRQAVVLSNLALTHQQLGAWNEANQVIATSLALLEAQPAERTTTLVLAQTLDIQGQLQLAMGQAEPALTTWERATALYGQLGDRASVTRSRINQTQALQVMGFYRRALEGLIDLNTDLQAQPDTLVKAVGLRSLGDALQSVGDLEQAQTVLAQSLAIAQTLKLTSEASATLFSLGNVAHARQQPDKAAIYYQQALQLDPPRLLQTQIQLNYLNSLVEHGSASTARSILPPIQTQVATLPPSRSTIYAQINLAQSMAKLGQDSVSLLVSAVQQARQLGDRRAESYALGHLGNLYEQKRQWSDAQRLTAQALLVVQTMNAPDIAYRWQWQLGRLLKQQGDLPGAIAAYRTTVKLLQSLRSDLVAVNRDVQFTFRDSVEPIYRQTVELLLTPATAGAEPSPDNLDEARRLMESLQLAELDNFFREACLNAQSVLLDEVVDRDNPTAAIFYPIILDNQLDVILKMPHQPLKHHSMPLPRTQVESVLATLQQAIKEPERGRETRSLSQQVYTWLIQPVEGDLKQSEVNTLVFVLDGLLRNIPMAALYDGKQFLVEKYAIALSPGLQLFTPRSLTQTRLTALTAGLAVPPPQFGFPPLPEVNTELGLIEQAGVTTTRLVDQGFTSNALEQQINAVPFQVVHLATHGKFSSQAKDTFILAADGPINVSELDSLLRRKSQNADEAVELLVLSACQTATGDNRATLGLAGVAIRAGARSTLASLWHIDDRSTAVFIGEFYRQLAKSGVTKAEAVRQAQITLMKEYPNYSRPGYWAPYVLVGNWL